MFDIFQYLLKITSCRIKENTKDKIKFTQKVLRIKEELDNNNKSKNYSEDEIIDLSLDRLLEFMGVKMKDKDNITDVDIRATESMLKSNRIDNNFKPKNKRIIKSLGEAMFDKGIVKDKLTYDDVITILLENYLQCFPEFKKYMLIEQDINQQYRTKELRRQKGIE